MSYATFLYHEIGLASLVLSPFTVHAIILLRMLRLVIFGATSLILVLYLKAIHFDELAIGLIISGIFLGDLLTSFLWSLAADQWGRKRTLLVSSVTLFFTCAVFAWCNDQAVLLIVAFLGVITPSGGEVGPFRSVEQSAIALLVSRNERLDIYAWYNLLGQFCGAIGSMVAGLVIDFALHHNKSEVLAYQAVFSIMTLCLGLMVLLLFLLSKDLEVKHVALPSSQGDETTPLVSPDAPQRTSPRRILPRLSSETLWVVVELSVLFGLDAFASSLAPVSWQTLYFRNKFHLSPTVLGRMYFEVGILSGVFSLLSTSLTKRLGPVVTMVVTHLPASIILAILPYPSSRSLSVALLLARALVQSMDVTPKHVLLAAIVPDSERTAVFGWVNVVKTLSSMVGPSAVGTLTQHGLQWLSFTLAGLLKATYDLALLATFMVHNRLHQH